MALSTEDFQPAQAVVLLQCGKSLLLDTGRMDAEDHDDILRVEWGRLEQGTISTVVSCKLGKKIHLLGSCGWY